MWLVEDMEEELCLDPFRVGGDEEESVILSSSSLSLSEESSVVEYRSLVETGKACPSYRGRLEGREPIRRRRLRGKKPIAPTMQLDRQNYERPWVELLCAAGMPAN